MLVVSREMVMKGLEELFVVGLKRGRKERVPKSGLKEWSQRAVSKSAARVIDAKHVSVINARRA